MRYRLIISTLSGAALSLAIAGSAMASPSPNGPGQPGAECGSSNATMRPGGSAAARGSAFNPSGISGAVYAGSDGTASLAHANSAHAISQYDVACFQVTTTH